MVTPVALRLSMSATAWPVTSFVQQCSEERLVIAARISQLIFEKSQRVKQFSATARLKSWSSISSRHHHASVTRASPML